MDNLEYRSSYWTKEGTKINVWSDPDEIPLEFFDHTVECPKEWVGANGWLFTPEGIERSRLKQPKEKQRREREDREPDEKWSLTGAASKRRKKR